MCKICDTLGLDPAGCVPITLEEMISEGMVEGCVQGFWKGKTKDAAYRKKISEAKKGSIGPNLGKFGPLASMYGKKHSEATKAKMSASQKKAAKTGKPRGHKKGEFNHTPETIEKIKASRKKQVITEEHKAALRAAAALNWEKRRLVYGPNGRRD